MSSVGSVQAENTDIANLDSALKTALSHCDYNHGIPNHDTVSHTPLELQFHRKHCRNFLCPTIYKDIFCLHKLQTS